MKNNFCKIDFYFLRLIDRFCGSWETALYAVYIPEPAGAGPLHNEHMIMRTRNESEAGAPCVA